MTLSISQASKEWGCSRTTIYHKIKAGELSINENKTIEPVEMLRVFGEPSKKSTNKKYKSTVQHNTVVDSHNNTVKTLLLEMELKHQKQLTELAEKKAEKESQRVEKVEQEKSELLRTVTDLSQSIKLLEMQKLDKEERKGFFKKFF